MKRLLFVLALFLLLAAIVLSFFAAFPRPYRDIVGESGLDGALVYSVMKAESNFREDAESDAGAVGIMQLLPSTAAFVCEREGIPFDAARLKEGEYNVTLGCAYLGYLMEEFEDETALAAYNAGEGKVHSWLKNSDFSADGIVLRKIPYPETEEYIKKVAKFRKNYEIFYGKT